MSAQYPSAAGTDANLFVAVNGLSTLLSDNPLTIGATTVNVVSTTGFPTAGYITIEAEAISYTGVTGTSFTGCTRGADGTTAASHVTGLSVFHNVIAAHHNVLKDEIKAIETDLVASYTGGSTTIATTFAKYLKLIGGTMSGAIAMGTNKITGVGNGSSAQDVAAFGQVNATALTGLAATLGTITSSDSPLTSVGKLINTRIAQVVVATSSTQFTTTSSTFQATNLSGSITPTAATSKILVMTCASGQVPAGHNAYATLERGASNLGGTLGFSQLSATSTTGINGSLNIVYLDSPASTSALTYAVYLKNDDNAASVIHGFTNQTQVIIMIEIAVGS